LVKPVEEGRVEGGGGFVDDTVSVVVDYGAYVFFFTVNDAYVLLILDCGVSCC
jgi:hypothetical protein